MKACIAPPDAWWQEPLFEPLAPWLSQHRSALPPELVQLHRWQQESGVQLRSGNGVPIRFESPSGFETGYERRIYDSGAMTVRENDWHDAFNALVWLAFPALKAALNARHVAAMQVVPQGAPRGRVRDAATLFDESGVIVAHNAPRLAEALIDQRWHEVFIARRGEAMRCMRFVVFGHAVYDKLRAPHHGMCGKVLPVQLEQWQLSLPTGQLVAALDAQVAGRLAQPDFLATPDALSPLPLLGIPGVTRANEDPAYYDDATQFRPRRTRSGGAGKEAV